MKSQSEKLESLEKQLKKKTADDETEYEHARRDVKEEAQKKQLNVDLLHEKLVMLENVAKKVNHRNKKKLNMILNRFHANKAEKSSFVAHLVLKLISSKDEETMLENEQKLRKHFGLDSRETMSGFVSSTNLAQAHPRVPMIPPGNWNFGPMAPFHYPTLMAPPPYPYPPAVPFPTLFRPSRGIMYQLLRGNSGKRAEPGFGRGHFE